MKNEQTKLPAKKGASNPTPSASEMPEASPRTLDSANAIDNVNIPYGSGKAKQHN